MGFSSLRDERGQSVFQTALLVENDAVACRTLEHRTVRRHLAEAGALDCYYALPRDEISRSHFDPLVPVRHVSGEAEPVRGQAFPEDYFCEGNRTPQYVQVGNEIPPLLASKIGEIVRNLMQHRDEQRKAARERFVTNSEEA